MSSLWTPGGERPVPRAAPAGSGAPSSDRPGPAAERDRGDPAGGPGPAGPQPNSEEMRRQMAELRDQLADTPAEVVVANHAYGLFELAALHLSIEVPQLEQARLAIDALGYLVEGLGDRLGEPAGELATALGQLRLAFVQVQAAARAPGGGGPPADAPGGAAPS
ncbi:MAG: hypothetical protein M0Z30_04100 [Actinomycetota bacterium]|nr:hypothetical protein [Actinomycetota bacterium]